MESSSSSENESILTAVVVGIAEEVATFAADVGNSGGKYGKRANIRRGKCSWGREYLVSEPRYRSSQFRQCFRITLKLFRRLLHDLPPLFPELNQKTDAAGRNGASSWQKILVSLRRLREGSSFDSIDDQARMSSESIRRAFRGFCHAVRVDYGPEFLNRPPFIQKLRAIERRFESLSFPGCVGSVDCMAVKWKNCPKAWKRQYHNPRHGKLATISVEALCDPDLYCWHLFVGPPTTNNDITIAANSPLFVSVLNGTRTIKLPEGYKLNEVVRNWNLYYLVDGIYPTWSIFLKPIHSPVNRQQQHMSSMQESRRKDVEHLFGVLQGRFHILTSRFHEWSDSEIVHVVETCRILHNMLVILSLGCEIYDEEDERGNPLHPNQIVSEFYYDTLPWNGEHWDNNNTPSVQTNQEWITHHLGTDAVIRNREAHKSHTWSSHGANIISQC